MAVTYLRLFPATTQFVMKNGMLNVAGLLHIYLEGTDDVAPVFDTDGSQLQQPVMLDNDGRARGLFVDASKVYWMKVCDRDDGQIYTVRKMVPSGGGAGSALGKSYSVISSDGTVNVTEFDNNGTTVFDLSCDIENEVSKWGSSVGLRSVIDGDDTWAEVHVISTAGSVTYNNGWAATKDCLGDIAASIEMSGHDASAISTIDTKMVVTVDGTEIFSETGLLDPTENAGRCSFEWKGELSEGQKVDARIYVKCVQGINLGLVGRVFYNEECDGVVGGDGTSYIPGTGIDISGDVISVTGMATQSAFDACCSSVENAISSLSSTVSGLTGQYVEISAISAESAVWNTVSGKEDKVNWGLSGNTVTSINGHDLAGGGADYSAGQYIEISTGNVISVTGLQPAGDYAYNSAVSSKVDQSAFDDCCSAMSGYVSSLSSDVSSLSSDVSSLSSTVSGLTGTYVEISSISAASSVWNSASAIPDKLDESAFTAYTSTAGQFTGVTTDSTLTGNGTTGSALGVNRMELDFDSSMTTSVNGSTATVGVNTGILSGYIPTSVSSDYMQVTGMSAYAYESSNSAKLDESAFTAYTATATSFTGVTTDSSLTGDGTTGNALGVNGMELVFDSSMSTSVAGDSAIVGVDTASITAAVATSITGFIPTSESANYMQVTGMSAYQPSGDYAYNSAVSSKLDESAFTAYTSTATSFTGVTTDATLTGDGTVGSALGVVRMELDFESSLSTSVNGNTASVGVNTAILSAYAYESSNSAKLDATAQVVTATAISVYAGTSYLHSVNATPISAARAGNAANAVLATSAWYDGTGRLISSLPDSAAVSAIASAYAGSAVSSVSGDYYPMTSNPSGYISTLPGDLVYSADLSAYQPSGEYIYASSLGIMEI